jgi:branched-chain amino acid transport system substrate-binding protein
MAIGQYETRYWSPDLDNPANKKYVSDFRKKYGYTPSFYGAQSYDGIMLIDSAIRAVHGNLKDKAGMIKAMEQANYASTRGKYTYNINHFPIQNYYLLQAVRDPGGQVEMQIQKVVLENQKDDYYKECHMK